MDYLIDIGSLETKQTAFSTLTSNVQTIIKSFTNGYLNSVNSSDISKVISKIKTNSSRLEKGYSNSKTWLDSYISEINELESSLAQQKSSSDKEIVEFTGEFEDIFGKVTMPMLKTNATTTTLTDDSIEAKRAAFIGDVDDTSLYYIDPRYPNMQKDLRCFDNETGEEITDGTVINMKVGETKVLTIAVPYNAGAVKRIIRTTAADVSSQTDRNKITSSKSNISGDPNNIQYVNYQYNHWPEGVDLHTNYYEWIIHADKTGRREISQTCEYESTAGTPKSMLGIIVNITD